MLYVEDDTIACDLIKSMLNHRYKDQVVHVAHTSKEGLELFRKHHDSLVITDTDLFKADSFRLAQSVRSESPETIIIFITGNCKTDSFPECWKSYPYHVLYKPLDFKALTGVLDRYVKR